MNCSFEDGISASIAIKYLQLRLSAEQTLSANIQSKAAENLDQIIEHMRSRLKPHLEYPRPSFPVQPL
jgi:hypothetical protein